MSAGSRGAEPTVVERPARAKWNLRLRVLGRGRDGFHALETLFVALELADRVRVERAGSGLGLAVEEGGAGAAEGVPADPTNLAWRAADAWLRATGTPAAHRVILEKRIPAGAGLGGGSADAAAVLRAFEALEGRRLGDERLMRLAGELGSDVPFALSGAACALAWERGRRLLPLEPPPSRAVLVAVPPLRVATPEAYGWLAAARAEAGAAGAPETDAGAGGGLVLPSAARLSSWSELENLARNDFEPVVFGRHPELRRVGDALRNAGGSPTLLCGSGAAVAAAFDSAAGRDAAREAVIAALGLEAETWRLLPTRTLPPRAEAEGPLLA